MQSVEFVSISNAHWPSKMNIIIPNLELRKLWGGEDGNPGSGCAGDELRLESSYVADPFPNCYVGSGGTGENGTGVIQDWKLGDRSELSQTCRHGVECPLGIINSSAQNLYSSHKRIHIERSVRLNIKDERGSDGDHHWPHVLADCARYKSTRWVLPVLVMFWGKPEVWTQMWGILISKVGHRYNFKNVYAGHTVRIKQNMSVGRVWLSGYEPHAPGRWPRDWPGTATTVGIEFYQLCYWPKGWMVD